MSAKETFLNLKKTFTETQSKLQNIAKDAFSEMSEELFTKYPQLAAFNWTQFTPYFNDGDECVFSARTDYPGLILADPEIDEAEEEEYDRYEVPEEYEAIVDSIRTFLSQFSDDDYRMMFGDHVQVTVRRTGTEVEEYSHD